MKISRAYRDRPPLTPKGVYSGDPRFKRPVRSEPAGEPNWTDQVPPVARSVRVSRYTAGSTRSRKYSEFTKTLKESKISYFARLDPLPAASAGIKHSIGRFPRKPYRVFQLGPERETTEYESLISEYHRLVELELKGDLLPAGRIKIQQIEAELDAIEAKKALQRNAGDSFQADIDKLTKLIELATQLRQLS